MNLIVDYIPYKLEQVWRINILSDSYTTIARELSVLMYVLVGI